MNRYTVFLLHAARADETLVDTLKEACAEASWACFTWKDFADDADQSILSRVERSIRRSDAVLAVLDEPIPSRSSRFEVNRNVLFEYGFARGAEVPVVPVVHSYLEGQVPSDLKNQLFLVYDGIEKNVRARVVTNLRRIASEITLQREFGDPSRMPVGATREAKELLTRLLPLQRTVSRRLLASAGDAGFEQSALEQGIDRLRSLRHECDRLARVVSAMRDVPTLQPFATAVMEDGRSALARANTRIEAGGGNELLALERARTRIERQNGRGRALLLGATSYLFVVLSVIGFTIAASLVALALATFAPTMGEGGAPIRAALGLGGVGVLCGFARWPGGGARWTLRLLILAATIAAGYALVRTPGAGRIWDASMGSTAGMASLATVIVWSALQPLPRPTGWLKALLVPGLLAVVIPITLWAIGWAAELAASGESSGTVLADFRRVALVAAQHIGIPIFGASIAATLAIQTPHKCYPVWRRLGLWR